jgi:hypothetical protein
MFVVAVLVVTCVILVQRVTQKARDIEAAAESQVSQDGPSLTIIFDRGMELSRDGRGRLVEMERSGSGPVDFTAKQVICDDTNVKLVGELTAEYRRNELAARKKYQDTRVRLIGTPMKVSPRTAGGAAIVTPGATWEFDDTLDIEQLNFTPDNLYLAVVEGVLVNPTRYKSCKLRGYGARLDGNGLKQSLRIH